ncbi:MAG: resolvase [Oscillospiraceae bacterium]|nr:resolvase [Oscillospiraceae bacterium]
MAIKIRIQKHGAMTEADRLQVATLLIKAGYTARIGRERPAGKDSGTYIYYVEYWDGTQS